MKKTLAALLLTAAVATPAMAQTYMQSMTSRHAVQAQPGAGYGAYGYAPPGWDSSELQSPVFARDPDPSVRQQLQIQSDITDR